MCTEESRAKVVGDELRVLYASCVSEITAIKQQQWHITNYGLLLYAALASLSKLVRRPTICEFVFLFVGALGVLVAGWYLIGLFSESIQIRRARLIEIRSKHFTDEFRRSWRYGKSEAEVPDSLQDKVSLLWFFRTVLVAGFAVVGWLLFRQANDV